MNADTLVGLLAMGVFSACCLLPILAQLHFEHTERKRARGMTTAEAGAAIDAHFDALDAEMSRLQGVMHADGFLPERRKVSRFQPTTKKAQEGSST